MEDYLNIPKRNPAKPLSECKRIGFKSFFMNEAIRIDSFLKGYIEGALFSSTDDNDSPLDKHYGQSDIAPKTFYHMRADCDRFQKENGKLIDESELSYERAGDLFWLTRNGHGVGFWSEVDDRDVGNALTKAAKAYGSFDLYVGDDGKLHGSPTSDIGAH